MATLTPAETDFFLHGDKVKHTLQDHEGVIVSFESETIALVDFGKGPKKTSLKYLKLVSKGRAVQLALRNDPAALELFWEHYAATTGRIEITCQPSCIDKEASKLSQMSSLSEINAVDYIKQTTEASHGAKFDILVGVDLPTGLISRLGVFFDVNGQRAHNGEVQINSRSLAEWLIRVHNVLPKKWY
jgi:hypothetical protein